MGKSNARRLLLVHPPVANPATPPGALFLAVARFGNPCVEIYDANLDGTLHQLRALENRERDAGRIGNSLQVLRSPRFFQPAEALAALETVRKAIGVWNAPGPGRTRLPAPVLSRCREGLAARIAQPGLRAVVLWVAEPTQKQGAQALEHFCRSTRPDLPVVLTGRAVGDPEGAGLFPLGRGGGLPEESGEPSPPSLGQYLAPRPVLPLIGPLPRAPFTLGFMKTWQERHGVQHFLLGDERLQPSHLAVLPADGSGKGDSWAVGLTCRLESAPRPTDLRAAHNAGLRMVCWRTSFGRPRPAGKVLWEAADAGIWNHLLLPVGSQDDALQDLVRFAAANPNIVHSWSAADAGAGQGDPVPRVYGKVPPLSGRPFWQELNDPAYLLLYLQKNT